MGRWDGWEMDIYCKERQRAWDGLFHSTQLVKTLTYVTYIYIYIFIHRFHNRKPTTHSIHLCKIKNLNTHPHPITPTHIPLAPPLHPPPHTIRRPHLLPRRHRPRAPLHNRIPGADRHRGRRRTGYGQGSDDGEHGDGAPVDGLERGGGGGCGGEEGRCDDGYHGDGGTVD